MASEVKAYLPAIECVTIFFLKELACSERKYIKSDKARHLSVPHFEGLTVKEFLEYANQHPGLHLYFPPEKEIDKLPRRSSRVKRNVHLLGPKVPFCSYFHYKNETFGIKRVKRPPWSTLSMKRGVKQKMSKVRNQLLFVFHVVRSHLMLGILTDFYKTKVGYQGFLSLFEGYFLANHLSSIDTFWKGIIRTL